MITEDILVYDSNFIISTARDAVKAFAGDGKEVTEKYTGEAIRFLNRSKPGELILQQTITHLKEVKMV